MQALDLVVEVGSSESSVYVLRDGLLEPFCRVSFGGGPIANLGIIRRPERFVEKFAEMYLRIFTEVPTPRVLVTTNLFGEDLNLNAHTRRPNLYNYNHTYRAVTSTQ